MEFKDILKSYRLKSGMTKAEFSRKLGIDSYSTYNNYEVGSSEPKIDMLIKIADLLNISLDDLVGRTSENEDNKLEKVIRETISNFNSTNVGMMLQLNYIDNDFINFKIGYSADKLIAIGEINKVDFIKQLSKIDIEISNTKAYKIFYYLAINVIDDALKKVNEDMKKLCQSFDDIEKNTGKTIANLYDENKKYRNMIDRPLKIQSDLIFLNQILYKYNENK